MKLGSRLQADLANNRGVLIVLAIVSLMFIYCAATITGFTGATSLDNLLMQAEILAIVAAGQTVVIIAGGIDLSVAWMITGASLLLTSMTEGRNEALVWAVPAVLGIAVVVGLVNGLGVAFLRISPIIMTLATNVALGGFVILQIGVSPADTSPPLIRNLVRGSVAGIPASLIGILVVLAVLGLLLGRSGYGRRLYAAGTNPVVASFSGVRTRPTIIGSYVISSVCAALAGFVLLGYVGTAFLGSGDVYQFTSIAAVTIGGASILGGSGNYFGTVAGVLLLVLLNTLIITKDLGAGASSIVYGAAILISAALSTAYLGGGVGRFVRRRGSTS